MSAANPSVSLVLAVTSDTAFLNLKGMPNLIRAFESLAVLLPSQKIIVAATPKDATVVRELLGSSNIRFELLNPQTLEPAILAPSLENLLGRFQAVLIHDASRPLTSRAQFEGVIAAFNEKTDAVRPVMAFTETLKILDADSVIKKTLDRSSVLRISTPELIRISAIDFTGSDCGWFLPLRKDARISHIEASPDGLRINTEEDRNFMELQAT